MILTPPLGERDITLDKKATQESVTPAPDETNEEGKPKVGSAPRIGSVIGDKYKILEKLGEGGVGSVYKAEHAYMNRVVALKFLNASMIDNPQTLARFRHEAKIASKILHPNAVTLFDYGVEGDIPYLVMQYIDGPTLKSIIAQEGALSLTRILNIVQQAGEALTTAHALGIIHRDLKPDNIMLTTVNGEEVVHVVDFGIAKFYGGEGQQTLMTQVGTIIGTPQYLSPEQALEKDLDARSDVYSFGIIVYEMITGEVPFQAPSFMEMLMKQVHERPKPIRQFKPQLKVPEALDKVVMKALEKDPNLRFSSMNEFVREFTKAVADVEASGVTWTPPKVKSVGVPGSTKKAIALGAVAVVLICGIGVLLVDKIIGQNGDVISSSEAVINEPSADPETVVVASDAESNSVEKAVEGVNEVTSDAGVVADTNEAGDLPGPNGDANIEANIVGAQVEPVAETPSESVVPETESIQTNTSQIDNSATSEVTQIENLSVSNNSETAALSNGAITQQIETAPVVITEDVKVPEAEVAVVEQTVIDQNTVTEAKKFAVEETTQEQVDLIEETPQVPLLKKLEITSTPTGATVFIENVEKGITPLTLQDMPLGTQKIELRKSGYTNKTETVNIRVGEEQKLAFSLTQQQGAVGPQQKEEARRLYRDGKDLMRRLDYRQAGSLLAKAVAADPRFIEAKLSLGVCYLRQERYELAREQFQNAMAIDKLHPPTRYNMATYYALTGQTDKALLELSIAIKFFPTVRNWAKDDPDLRSIQNHPRFRELVSG